VRAIYLDGVASGNATFEQTAPEWEKWDAGHLPGARIVARYDGDVVGGEVLGWAALSPVSSRCVYAGVAEVSVYVAERARGRGVGHEHRTARARGIPHRRPARAARADERAMARCAADGTQKFGHGPVSGETKWMLRPPPV
jgi:L-amino acid N-acyltransferase YncA